MNIEFIFNDIKDDSIIYHKEQKYDDVLTEIDAIKNVCQDKILKVIIETALLTNEEKIKMCEIISKSNADFIKTSTGFVKPGATFEDMELFSKYLKEGKQIKPSGGISTFEDAEKFIRLGATRLGASGLIKIIKEEKV